MGKILGLDLGTNSIGWAVVEREDGKIQFAEETNGHPSKGVIIFPEGVKEEKGNRKSRAAERTGYRSARRLKFRRKLRKYETLLVLAENKMCPLTVDEVKAWRKSGFKDYPDNKKFLEWLRTDEKKGINPYYFRNKFSSKKYDWENDPVLAYELGRSFYHIAQRRGFSSNKNETGGEDKVDDLRLQWENIRYTIDETTTIENLKGDIELLVTNFKEEDDAKVKRVIKSIEKTLKETIEIQSIIASIESTVRKKENLGKVKKGIIDLNEQIEKGGYETLGQYFYHLYKSDRHNNENKIRTRYTGREEHYLEEFDRICDKQKLQTTLISDLKKAIFYQRPLKSQKGLVGKCSFEKNKPRCPVSHPAYEEYRMWHFINNIRVKDGNEFRRLAKAEINKFLPKFYRKKAQFDFKEIAKEIRSDYPVLTDSKGKPDNKTEPDPFKTYFNYKGNASVPGCPVTAELMSIFGKKWEDKNRWKEELYAAWKNTRRNDGKEKTIDEVVTEYWHALFYADFVGNKEDLIGKSRKEKLTEFAKKNTTLSDGQVETYSAIRGLKKEYANLSLNAIHKILRYLKPQEDKLGLIYSHAVFMANMEKVVDPGEWKDNTKNQEVIKQGIDHILETHDFDCKIAAIVNAQLSECRDAKPQQFYSEQSEETYKDDIEKRLKNVFGEKSWQKREDKNEIINATHELFIERFKRKMGEGEFLKIERIDERVMSFLIGDNEDGVVYCSDQDRAEKLLYHPSDLERFQPKPIREKGKIVMRNDNPLMGLGSPVIPSIKNPVAMRALHQLRKLVNELIREGIIDRRTKVHIELTRELNDANKRAAIEKYQRERERQHEVYRIKIQELYKKETGKSISPTEDDVLKFGFWVEQDPEHDPQVIISDKDVEKYQYWDEQFHRCIYTGKTIRISDFIGPNPKFDIEHTIPRSISLDNSQMNKTLCYNKYNRDEKANKLPTECKNFDAPQPITFKDGEKLVCPAINTGIIEKWKKKYLELDEQIKILVKRAKGATTKEQKDKIIQERHYLTKHRDYWKGKYERFSMEEVKAGFKNSQKVDTGIITKYAREFLASVFKNKNGNPNVYALNGQMTDVFRKAWGLHEKEYDENGEPVLDNHGLPVYKKKDRSNHIHHCIDAVTIACITKEKYEVMAHAWGLEDKGLLKQARKEMENSKPWEDFTTDIGKLKNEVLIVHTHKDNVPKQSKKKERKRGKIQYLLEYETDAKGKVKINERRKKIPKKDMNGKLVYKLDQEDNRIPKIQEGDTVRGSLHKDTFYGAIKDKNGHQIFVIRKKLVDLSDADLDKIIDPKVKEIAIKGRSEERELKKKMEAIKKQLRNAENEQENKLKTELEAIQRRINDELYVIPPKEGTTVFTPIRKVRIKAHLAEPLPEFKQHRDIKKSIDGSEKHPHKKWIYVQNDENYCLAIYENEDQSKRAAQVVKMIDAAEYFNESSDYRKEHPLVPEKKSMKIKGFLKPDTLVLFYIEQPNELWDLDKADLRKRLYFVRKTAKNGQTTFQFHQEARNDNQLKEDYQKEHGTEPSKSLTNGESTIDFNNLPIPKLLLSPVKMKMLIESEDFTISATGKIEPL